MPPHFFLTLRSLDDRGDSDFVGLVDDLAASGR